MNIKNTNTITELQAHHNNVYEMTNIFTKIYPIFSANDYTNKKTSSNISDLNAHISEKIKNSKDKNDLKFNDNDFYQILNKRKLSSFLCKSESQEGLCQTCENIKFKLQNHFAKINDENFSTIQHILKHDTDKYNIEKLYKKCQTFNNAFKKNEISNYLQNSTIKKMPYTYTTTNSKEGR